jgi:diguanylate cyclase (GGDEF)-like protein
MMVTADDGTIHELAQIIAKEIRDTDRLGRTGSGALGLMLLDSNVDQAALVIQRLVAGIEHYEFAMPLRIAVGAACYPTHAVDLESLKRQALSRPLASWRGGGA